MKYILLDTNMIIYREGEKKLSQNIQLLSRLLLDSTQYKLCIHPLSKKELLGYKDEEKRETILSKINVYPILENTPYASEEFCNKCGKNKGQNNYIDNCMIYAVYKNCVSYLLTNDQGIHKKAKKLFLSKKVLTIEEGIELLSKDKMEVYTNTPVFIQEKYLYTIDTDNDFFDSLRKDYKDFDIWLNKKKQTHSKAYVTYLDNDQKKIGAFLMLKNEDESEQYEDFEKKFKPGKRIKISTFKVIDNGKGIGEAFIKLIIDRALKLNIDEIYVTAFEKQERLTTLFAEYGFVFYTRKKTKGGHNDVELENVYLKNLFKGITEYPVIYYLNQQVYLIPIQPEFSKRLFYDAFEYHQISLFDLNGASTCSNVIKKVYISKARIKGIHKDDILLFYFSNEKQELAVVGVVDEVFKANEIDTYENFQRIVKRRTVYETSYLKEAYEKGYLIILFEYFLDLQEHVSLDKAVSEGLIKGAPQSIQKMEKEKFKKLVRLSRSEKQILI